MRDISEQIATEGQVIALTKYLAGRHDYEKELVQSLHLLTFKEVNVLMSRLHPRYKNRLRLFKQPNPITLDQKDEIEELICDKNLFEISRSILKKCGAQFVDTLTFWEADKCIKMLQACPDIPRELNGKSA